MIQVVLSTGYTVVDVPKPNRPFIPPGSINQVPALAVVIAGIVAYVGQWVKLCDPTVDARSWRSEVI